MEKPIGAEGTLKIENVDGKIVVSVGYDGKGLDGSLSVAIESDYFVDLLAAAVPGDSPLEALVIATLKSALKSVKI